MAMFGAGAWSPKHVPGDLMEDPNFRPDFGGMPGMQPAPELGSNISGDAPKTPFFGQGGTGRHIVGALGDALSAAGGGQGIYAPMMEQRRRETFAEHQAQRKAADQAAEWDRQQRWRIANPEPSEFERTMTGAGIDPTSARGRELYGRRVENIANPIQGVPVTNADGSKSLQFIRPGDLGGLPQPAPRAPEAILKDASETGFISPEEAAVIQSSLGANGAGAFGQWMKGNGVAIGKRLPNGQTAYKINGKWYDNPEGR